ncbi:hypothetical protein I7X12_13150 [Halosimplex litoreum]|uniref:Uncharacterized protein n=1 Tax=Halosimplex litoreum TaxID=1198301 RepID=A0A7T3KUF0_9EURY|nr:DUF6653 family protein [Halosimplex litoreum]QPV61695.1 hypothetical protein I7X12_13150 [Halosimplex litoreum]
MSTTVPSERLAEFLWERHANPWSGWTRVFAFPVLVYAVLTRRKRLLVAAVAAIAVNPVVLPQPDDARAWTSEVIQAERYWADHGNQGALLRSLDAATLPVTVAALYAAYRRKPKSTAVLTAASMALKFAFVNALVRHYESATEGDTPTAATDAAATDSARTDASEDGPP